MNIARKTIQRVNIYLIIILGIVYNFHRYILKYNSEGTSPTYTNTPLTWQLSKFPIITILILFFYCVSKFKSKILDVFVIIYGFVFFILLVNLCSYFIYGVVSLKEVEYCFYFILILPFCFVKDDINIEYQKMIKLSAIILLISNFIVVYNYIFFKRLPALAYEGGLVRFGGFWDDPNGYGFICVFFFYFFLLRKNRLLLSLTFFNILITFSFTAYFMLVISACFWIVELRNKINYKIVLGIFSFLAVIIFSCIYNISYLLELLESKSGSVDQHLSNALVFNIVPLAKAPIQFSETWYLSFFYNYFPISILPLLCFSYLLLMTFKRNVNVFMRFFLFLYILYCLFLPMYYIFPINIFFVVVLINYFKITHRYYDKTKNSLQDKLSQY